MDDFEFNVEEPLREEPLREEPLREDLLFFLQDFLRQAVLEEKKLQELRGLLQQRQRGNDEYKYDEIGNWFNEYISMWATGMWTPGFDKIVQQIFEPKTVIQLGKFNELLPLRVSLSVPLWVSAYAHIWKIWKHRSVSLEWLRREMIIARYTKEDVEVEEVEVEREVDWLTEWIGASERAKKRAERAKKRAAELAMKADRAEQAKAKKRKKKAKNAKRAKRGKFNFRI